MVFGFLGMGVVLAVVFLWMAVNIVNDYERVVVFRLGRLVASRGPGLVLIVPLIERAVRVRSPHHHHGRAAAGRDTRDNVTVKVDAVVLFRVVDANRATTVVADFIRATSLLVDDDAAQRLRPGRA